MRSVRVMKEVEANSRDYEVEWEWEWDQLPGVSGRFWACCGYLWLLCVPLVFGWLGYVLATFCVRFRDGGGGSSKELGHR